MQLEQSLPEYLPIKSHPALLQSRDVRPRAAATARDVERAQRRMQVALANTEAELRRSVRKAVEASVDNISNELDRLTDEQRQHVIAEIVANGNELLEDQLRQLREVFQMQ